MASPFTEYVIFNDKHSRYAKDRPAAYASVAMVSQHPDHLKWSAMPSKHTNRLVPPCVTHRKKDNSTEPPFQGMKAPSRLCTECFEVHLASVYIVDAFHLSQFGLTDVTSFGKYRITHNCWTRHVVLSV